MGQHSGLTAERRLTAWAATVEAFRDRTSTERRAIEGALVASSGLSPAGLEAGLEAVLGGVRERAARCVFAAAKDRPVPTEPVLVVLAGNLPALVVQPLLPILALGGRAVIKAASSEPVFPAAFVAALVRREPTLGEYFEVAGWSGGTEAIESSVLARVGAVLAYGGEESTASLARRAPGRTVVYGPKTSIALVAADVDMETVAAGLARDVTLFDQRGCLSITAVFVERSRARALTEALARQLQEFAERWPPGPTEPSAWAAVQSKRATADLAGWYRPKLALEAGTVLEVSPGTPFQPGPGLRTVCVHPLERLDRALELLAPWAGKLQGAGLAGEAAWPLGPGLARLGVSRLAAPGDLQSPDATWHNGGVDPIEVLAGVRPRRV